MSSNYENQPSRPLSSVVHFKHGYSERQRQTISFPENSEYTKQSPKDECDINVIMARYLATGDIPNLNERQPQYLDVTGHDFQNHMEIVAGAQTLFSELPSNIRDRFRHDPAQFLDFVNNPDNKNELRSMGLLRPEISSARTQPSPTPQKSSQGPDNSLPEAV